MKNLQHSMLLCQKFRIASFACKWETISPRHAVIESYLKKSG